MAVDPQPDLRPTLRYTGRPRVSVDMPLHCQECGSRWNDPGDRWLVYFTDEEPPEAAVYCPPCGRREFGALTGE